jgi:hypothetical protein
MAVMATMNKTVMAVSILAVSVLACGTSTPRKLELYPSPTVLPTQTERVVIHTSTPLSTYTPIVKVVTSTSEPGYLCVTAVDTVHLRPSPSVENYPVMVLSSGARLTDLGGRDGNWAFVSTGKERGWINLDFVKLCE